eukprot:24855-Chlamydomonas_euryale.AAC.3
MHARQRAQPSTDMHGKQPAGRTSALLEQRKAVQAHVDQVHELHTAAAADGSARQRKLRRERSLRVSGGEGRGGRGRVGGGRAGTSMCKACDCMHSCARIRAPGWRLRGARGRGGEDGGAPAPSGLAPAGGRSTHGSDVNVCVLPLGGVLLSSRSSVESCARKRVRVYMCT